MPAPPLCSDGRYRILAACGPARRAALAGEAWRCGGLACSTSARQVGGSHGPREMAVLTLAAGQEVPWHWHSNVSDTFFCMKGPMVIETRAPREVVELRPGETHVVPAKRAHRVAGKNDGPCKFGILQGTGTYDFNPVGGG